MATDHHQDSFDQDKYDRYDTFDDPVLGDADPNRNGFFGDFSRLIDQIRVNNAASKLDDNVAVGEDRALTVTGNWAAVPHEELYASVHTNNNPAEAYALAREWTQLGNAMAENSRVMDETIRSTESGWTGPAAEVARQATLKLATWGGDAAQTSQYMGTRIADQGLAAETAKASMPEPVNFDYEQMLRQGFATGGLAGLSQAVVDVQAASAKARTAHAQAAQVMANMEAQSRSVDETTPRFVRPPEVTDSAATPVDGLLRSQSMPAGTRTDATALASGQLAGRLRTDSAGVPANVPEMPDSTAAAFAGAGAGAPNVPGGMPSMPASASVPGVPDFSGMAAGITGGAPRGGTPSYTPPNLQAPDMPDIGTSTAGYTPSIPGGHVGGTTFGSPSYSGGTPDISGLLPPNVVGGRAGRDSLPPTYTAPKLPGGGINPVTGLPYTPDEIRRGLPTSMRGGMPGGGGGAGFGGGGAGGGAYGAAGAGRGLPIGGSVGAVAAAEQAAARNAAGIVGQNGAPGSPGMGGAPHGGAKGGGDNDKEHRNKYATNEKIVEEPGRMVPSVIGEKSAKQLKEEQAG
jgi:hypothetical protein